MAYKKCPKCGNLASADSAFCNKCGTPLSSVVPTNECPKCHAQVPQGSAFCPKCGTPVGTANPTEAPVGLAAGEQANGKPDNRKRNMLIAAAIAIVALFVIVQVFYSGKSSHEAEEIDSTSVVTNIGMDQALTIFNKALNDNNFANDQSHAVFAQPISNSPTEQPDTIVGVTVLSDPTGHSFFKIYTVTTTDEGNTWQIKNNIVRYLNNRAITFDSGALIADPGQVPQQVQLKGNTYVFFAYLNMPANAIDGATARVSLCLYNVHTQALSSIDYDGPIKSKDGRQYVVGKPSNAVGGDEGRYLQEQAATISVIYVPTQEELDAEAEEAEQKELSAPEKCIEKWNADNGDNLATLTTGEQVTMQASTYDKPLANFKNPRKNIKNDSYVAIIDEQGNVLGFNKSSRKYFVIYAGDAKASDIGFASDGDNEHQLNIKTSHGRIVYDMQSDKAKLEK